MHNKVALIHKEAQEKKAMVEARRGEEMLKAEELAAKHRATGTVPKKLAQDKRVLTTSYAYGTPKLGNPFGVSVRGTKTHVKAQFLKHLRRRQDVDQFQ